MSMHVDDDAANDLDLLPGADAIAAFMGLKPRQVYHLNSLGELPTFTLGGKLCSTKSLIREHIAKRVKETLIRKGAGA